MQQPHAKAHDLLGLLSEVAHGHIQALHEKNRGGVDQNHKIAVVVQSHLGAQFPKQTCGIN